MSSRGEVMALSALNRKLLRDLFAMKGQALAIAMVVAGGVAMFVMYLSNFDSLRQTQQAYYERQRFADVFATLKRAPASLAEPRSPRFRASLRSRPASSPTVTLDVPGLDEPAARLLISIDADRRPPVNDIFLRRGRWIEAGPGTKCSRARPSSRRTGCARGPGGRGDQRSAAPIDHCWRRAVTGACLQHQAWGDRSGQPPVRDLLDRAAGARERVRHGRRFQ